MKARTQERSTIPSSGISIFIDFYRRKRNICVFLNISTFLIGKGKRERKEHFMFSHNFCRLVDRRSTSPRLTLLQKRGACLALVGILLTLGLAFGAFPHPSIAHAASTHQQGPSIPADVSSSCQLLWIPPDAPNNTFFGGNTLVSGVCAFANNFNTWLIMQTDGNLVIYDGSGRALWVAPGTWCGSSCAGWGNFAAMQRDGNFCIYPNYPSGGNALWCSNTGGNPGAFLVIQDDGNVVIYDSTGSRPLWATGTNH